MQALGFDRPRTRPDKKKEEERMNGDEFLLRSCSKSYLRENKDGLFHSAREGRIGLKWASGYKGPP